MRKFNQGETQIRKKGITKTNGAANIPGFQAISPLASIGTIDVFPTKQEFYVSSPFDEAMERTTLAQSLQCKGVPDLVIPETKLYGVRNSLHYNCRPQLGNQRGDPKGLLSDPMFPTNNKLLVPVHSFFNNLKSTL